MVVCFDLMVGFYAGFGYCLRVNLLQDLFVLL